MYSYHVLRLSVIVLVLWTILITGILCDNKYRICVLDGKGDFKKSLTYCPILDQADSKVECVIGTDRLDCLRRISKGKVDFSIFTPEDLVTAINSEIEVLITNQMRFTENVNEYEVVAVINDASGIKSQYDLKNKRLCHPGYGYETDWTNILANYLESTIVPQTCAASLTLTENRIRSSSNFFRSACKAGPWVNDRNLDAELKRKYPNLCDLCYSPSTCSMQDKYWGRRGPLFCLTDGDGDVAWVRLDDARGHFGIVPGTTFSSPNGFSYLCKDGTLQPVNSTKMPCVWVVKPWPVVAAKSAKASEIQALLFEVKASNADNPNAWQTALLRLMETFQVDITAQKPITSIDGFLNDAPGFLSANSFPGCHPPRTIRICSAGNLANAKCGWMREAAAVYAIEPDLDCLRGDNVTHCMYAVDKGLADVVVVDGDSVHEGISKYNLQPLFYEVVSDDSKYTTIAVVKSQSTIHSFGDLRNMKACFPKFDGVAFNTALFALRNSSLLTSCEKNFSAFFSEICAPGAAQNDSLRHLETLCQDNSFEGEYGALRCLKNSGDVAFMSKKSFQNYFTDPTEMIGNTTLDEYRILCLNEKENNTDCYLSWAPVGQAMISKTKLQMWKEDSLDVFLQLDNLFGKNHKSITTPFSMFGLFDSTSNVLFHDATAKLKKVPYYKSSDLMRKYKEYNYILNTTINCIEERHSAKDLLRPCAALLISIMLVLKLIR